MPGIAVSASRIDEAIARRMAGDGELHNVLAAQRSNQLRRRSQRNDPSVIHDADAVAEPLRLIHVVGGQDDGATRLFELVHEVPQMTPRLRVEASGRLIEKKQFRIADQCAGHGQPLLLSS